MSALRLSSSLTPLEAYARQAPWPQGLTVLRPLAGNGRALAGERQGDSRDRVSLSGAARQQADEAKTATAPVAGEAEEKTSVAAAAAPQTQLTTAELEQVRQLQQRDQEVRVHEAAHAAAGGPYAGAPTLRYETGPDGRRYAVEGAVNVDLAAVAGDPAATIEKMAVIERAALAPAQPSAQDYRVAARARRQAASARQELAEQQRAAPQMAQVAAAYSRMAGRAADTATEPGHAAAAAISARLDGPGLRA
ncbi:putative metalloprotease CJM1_0395 family protein [Desulfuromonas thiophila]|uniref:SprA-related family protein n=1 Tax=Desulfuromonas thiophila TaxID=57664 RepID=A0A1G7DBJ2_9BACT|nr:putative metalloprotease CJM1_0395 family protein [Desulfuromonas thiophila]SDE48912.1 SprA-related family protein [Desulfuromonas thiophila]